MWAKQSHIWDLWFICEGGLLKWVLFSPLIIKQSDHAIWRSERYELTQLRMWIIRCKSQSRTYSCNYFVLLWSEEVAFYLKCFQNQLLNSGVPNSILTRFCTFRATGRVFLRFVFYQPSNSVSTSQPIFVRVAILVWFTVLTGREGHRGGGRVCSKATCSEVLRIFTRCLWESLPVLLGESA